MAFELHIALYHIHSLFGCDFNLAVWQFFVHTPNFQYSLIAIVCIAGRIFCQITVTPTMITNRFTKYLTHQ